eukprot:6518329-Heterocapsa_arctica.AAC.1
MFAETVGRGGRCGRRDWHPGFVMYSLATRLENSKAENRPTIRLLEQYCHLSTFLSLCKRAPYPK